MARASDNCSSFSRGKTRTKRFRQSVPTYGCLSRNQLPDSGGVYRVACSTCSVVERHPLKPKNKSGRHRRYTYHRATIEAQGQERSIFSGVGYHNTTTTTTTTTITTTTALGDTTRREYSPVKRARSSPRGKYAGPAARWRLQSASGGVGGAVARQW